MALTPAQLSEARTRQRGGALLREIAAALGVEYEAVCLGLYGDNSWTPRVAGGAETSRHLATSQAARAIGARDLADVPTAQSQAKATEAEPAPVQTAVPDGVATRLTAGRTAEVEVAPGAGLDAIAAAAGADHAPVVAPVVAPAPVKAGPARQPEGASAPVAPSDPISRGASAASLFKLRNGVGEYLHERGRGMTRLSQFMWRGTADEVRVLQKRHSHLAELEPVPVLGS